MDLSGRAKPPRERHLGFRLATEENTAGESVAVDAHHSITLEKAYKERPGALHEGGAQCSMVFGDPRDTKKIIRRTLWRVYDRRYSLSNRLHQRRLGECALA
jgi:hypothetical protein